MEKFVVTISGVDFQFTLQAQGEKVAVLSAAKKFFPQTDVAVRSFGTDEEMDMTTG